MKTERSRDGPPLEICRRVCPAFYSMSTTAIVVAINRFRFNRDQGFGWIWQTADRLFEAN